MFDDKVKLERPYSLYGGKFLEGLGGYTVALFAAYIDLGLWVKRTLLIA
jgi:hypothetical protein